MNRLAAIKGRHTGIGMRYADGRCDMATAIVLETAGSGPESSDADFSESASAHSTREQGERTIVAMASEGPRFH